MCALVCACVCVVRRRFPTDDVMEMSAVDMATSLVAGVRLLLGNVTSLDDVRARERQYESLQSQLRKSLDRSDEVSSLICVCVCVRLVGCLAGRLVCVFASVECS